MSFAKQFRGVFPKVIPVKTTVDFDNVATGSGTFNSKDVTVPGAALGDAVIGISVDVDTVDAVIVGAVTAANTVTLTLLNNTAGAVNLASATARFCVVGYGN